MCIPHILLWNIIVGLGEDFYIRPVTSRHPPLSPNQTKCCCYHCFWHWLQTPDQLLGATPCLACKCPTVAAEAIIALIISHSRWPLEHTHQHQLAANPKMAQAQASRGVTSQEHTGWPLSKKLNHKTNRFFPVWCNILGFCHASIFWPQFLHFYHPFYQFCCIKSGKCFMECCQLQP